MRARDRLALAFIIAVPVVAAVTPSCGGSGNNSTGNPGGAGHGGAAQGGATHGGSGVGGSGAGGSGSGATTTSSASTSSGTGAYVIAECQGHVYECGDTIDNDGDGLIDADDPDCLGPCDNTEGNFYGGIPGQGGPGCDIDCYFDQDSGHGNDDCYWNHKCDPHEVAPDYAPEVWLGNKCEYDTTFKITPSLGCDDAYMTQSQECYDYCGPLTPNGCDCFGCCELPAGSGKYVWLGTEDGSGNGTCDIAHLGDPTKCAPCLPVKACLNDCGHCEVCIGKPTLPADCIPDGGSTSSSSSGSTSSGGAQCEDGVQFCGQPGQDPCTAGYYCITGCCRPVPK